MNAAWLAALLLVAGCATTSKPAEPARPEVPSDCRCEDGCIQACEVTEQTTTYRRVPREEGAPAEPHETEPPDAFELWEERIEPLSDEKADAVADELGIQAEDLFAVVRADLIRGRGSEVAVLRADGELSVYRADKRWARLELGDVIEATGIQLVDERAELVVRHVVDGVEHLTVCRVIGDAIAKVYEVELDGRSVEFVHLGDERAIRVRGPDSTEVLRWNPWEGMFRVPQRAPTAP